MRRLLHAAAVLFIFSPFACISEADAQSKPPTIETAPIVQMTPNTETAMPIRIASGAALPRQTTVLIRGMPESATLTEGRVFDSGVWFVPAADLPRLKIVATSQAAGLKIPLRISVVALEGTILAEAKMTLAVTGPGDAMVTETTVAANIPARATSTLDPLQPSAEEQASAQRSQSASLSLPVPAGSAPKAPLRTPAISPAEEAQRLKSGQAALDLDDIAGARLIYEYLANHGSAAGAYRLAQTYDPQILPRTTIGALVKPDESVAARWYAKAAELGHPEARNKMAGTR